MSSALVLVLFTGLTVYHYFTQRITSTGFKNVPKSNSEILKKYIEDHDDLQIADEVNLHLLHSINTQKDEDLKLTLIDFYNHEIVKHNNNEAEIFYCIHKKLEPSVVSKMIDSKYPGFLEPIKQALRRGLGSCSAHKVCKSM